jgi:hypothetical protein
MPITRKKALERIKGLENAVLYHLNDHIPSAIGTSPQDIPHWRKEVNSFLDQMDALAEHVGVKTGAQWRARIAELHRQLAVLLGDME